MQRIQEFPLTDSEGRSKASIGLRALGCLVALLGLILGGSLASTQAVAQSRIFSFSQWATVTPAAGWSFVAGDFVRGGGTDVAGYHPSNGSVWVGTNRPR
jgi:hypothetical protein